VERSHLLNTPNSDRTLSTSQTVIAPPQLPKQRTACSSASLSHPSTPKQRTACSSASLSHPSTPQIAIALPPTSQKRTACKQRSHFLQLPKHSFFNEPQRHRGHREREIALPLTSQTANCLQQRFAIAPPQFPNSDSYGALALSHPLNSKQQSHPSNFPNSELLAAALRYRTPSTSPNSDRILPTPQTANCLQQRFAIASLQLPKSELLAAALRYRTPQTSQTSFLIEPQRHREHRERAIAAPQTSQMANCLQQRFAIASPQIPKQRSHSSTSPTSQKAIAPLQLPKQRSHPLNLINSDS
jgi:hypothetical protein